MKIKGRCSTFKFRPPGVLKSSVSEYPIPRLPPTEAFVNQDMHALARGIESTDTASLQFLKTIPPGMLFFCLLENAYFIVKEGMDGVIITDDFYLIEESLCFCPNNQMNAADIPSLQDVQELDEVFLSFDSKWMHYDHWIGYTLSKAYIANRFTPPDVKIAIPAYRDGPDAPHHISRELYDESLEKTGIKPRTIQLKDGIYKAKKLSYFWPNNHQARSYFNFKDAREVCSFLSKNIKHQNDLPARFYISQEDANGQTLNDDASAVLQEALKELNIPSVKLSSMSWTDQISLFSKAELIVSSHRPELVNILFCQQDAEVLEFTHPLNKQKFLPAWPYMIASTNGIQYSFIDISTTKLTPGLIKKAINQLDAL